MDISYLAYIYTYAYNSLYTYIYICIHEMSLNPNLVYGRYTLLVDIATSDYEKWSTPVRWFQALSSCFGGPNSVACSENTMQAGSSKHGMSGQSTHLQAIWCSPPRRFTSRWTSNSSSMPKNNLIPDSTSKHVWKTFNSMNSTNSTGSATCFHRNSSRTHQLPTASTSTSASMNSLRVKALQESWWSCCSGRPRVHHGSLPPGPQHTTANEVMENARVRGIKWDQVMR